MTTIDTRPNEGPGAWVDRLLLATNAHDIEALVDCFDVAYVNETPAHPSRSFRGNGQVRRNWSQIFAGVPDLTAEVVGRAVVGNTVWVEWHNRGTRRDGTAHAMKGVTVFGVEDGRATWARFYLEPVDEQAGTVDDAVGRAVSGAPMAAPAQP